MVKRCVKCNSFQKKEAIMVSMENGKEMCMECYKKYTEEHPEIKHSIEFAEIKFNPSEIFEEKVIENSELKIEEIITPGAKGITNFQMIPVIKKAVDENNIEVIKLMKDKYAEVFESTRKYIGKKRIDALKSIGI